MTDFKSIVCRQVESDTLDYKAPLNWLKLNRAGKAKFVRHCLALANTRGGYVVVGVEEDASGHPSVYTGLTKEQAKSFDPSIVGPFINRYADPAIDFTIERPLIDGKRYAIFVVKPFISVPHVCGNSLEGELQQGVFYIRTTDAASRPAYRSSEMHALIQRALRNQRELLGRMLRGLLYENHFIADESAGRSRFDEARRHIRDFFIQRRQPEANAPYCRIELSMTPPEFVEDKFSFKELKHAALASLDRNLCSGYLLPTELRKSYAASNGIRVFPPEKQKLWQLTSSGMCFFASNLTLPAAELDFRQLAELLNAALSMLGSLYSELGYTDELIAFELKLRNSDKFTLVNRSGDPFPPSCRANSPQVKIEVSRSAADWLSGRSAHLAYILRFLAEHFHVPDGRLAKLSDEL